MLEHDGVYIPGLDVDRVVALDVHPVPPAQRPRAEVERHRERVARCLVGSRPPASASAAGARVAVIVVMIMGSVAVAGRSVQGRRRQAPG